MKTYCTTTISALTISGGTWSTQIFGEVKKNREDALALLKRRVVEGLNPKDSWNEELEFAMIVSHIDGQPLIRRTFSNLGLEALAVRA